MILSRSPYYFNVDYKNQYVTTVVFSLDIGSGTTTSIVSEQNYTFNKLKPSSDFTNTWIDLSPYIRDVFDYSNLELSSYTSPEVIPSNEVVIVRYVATEYDSINSTPTPITETTIATDGYGYYQEGQNYEPSKKILLTHQNYKTDIRGKFIVPLLCESGDSDPTINGVSVDLDFTEDVTNYVKYLVIPLSYYSENLTVVFEGESIFIELIEECKYDINELQFLNRFGVLEIIHFYKSAKESLSVESSDFKNAYTNGISYDTSRHQIQKYGIKTNKDVTISTGFLNESYNNTMQELLQSEHVWLNGKPINVNSSSLDFKTRLVDKLISYSIKFDYAYDEINNV